MRSRFISCLVVVTTLLASARGSADQAPPSPLDAIPDKMPFSEPYGAPISEKRAQ